MAEITNPDINEVLRKLKDMSAENQIAPADPQQGVLSKGQPFNTDFADNSKDIDAFSKDKTNLSPQSKYELNDKYSDTLTTDPNYPLPVSEEPTTEETKPISTVTTHNENPPKRVEPQIRNQRKPSRLSRLAGTVSGLTTIVLPLALGHATSASGNTLTTGATDTIDNTGHTLRIDPSQQSTQPRAPYGPTFEQNYSAVSNINASPTFGETVGITMRVDAVDTAPTYEFGDQAFADKWNSIDGLTPAERVAKGMVASQYFGPKYSPGLSEKIENKSYPVQYFEKERMEKQPSGEVTSGLLSRDLIRGGANIVVSGDANDPNPVTYKDLQKFATVFEGENKTIDKTDKPVTAEFKNGALVENGYDGRIGLLTNGHYFSETGHNVPDQFLGSFAPEEQGLTKYDLAAKRLVDTAGYPLTEAFVKNVKIGNTTVPVMIQAFERRILTYNPKNDKNYQVEWGNIGAAFYDFTYKNVGKPEPTPTATAIPAQPSPTPTEAVKPPEEDKGTLYLEVTHKAGSFKFYAQKDASIIKDHYKNNITAAMNEFSNIANYQGPVDFELDCLTTGTLDGTGGDRTFKKLKIIPGGASATQGTVRWFTTEPEITTNNGKTIVKVYFATEGNLSSSNLDKIKNNSNQNGKNNVNLNVGQDIFMRTSKIPDTQTYFNILNSHPGLADLTGVINGVVDKDKLPFELVPATQTP